MGKAQKLLHIMKNTVFFFLWNHSNNFEWQFTIDVYYPMTHKQI